ncbi:2Fe-2S iron-sulfur cluster-binding protein, partial [Marinobacter sp. 1Y8]
VDNNSNQTFDRTVPVEEHVVYLRSRQRQFSSDTTILAAAENADVRLAHGCRQGICQLCRCNKVSGVVKNIQTGKVSGDGYESIQTCINIAMTDVILDV